MARVETWLAFAQPLLTRTVDTQFEETTVEDQLEQATKKEKENVWICSNMYVLQYS